jgi:hypothetical protein
MLKHFMGWKADRLFFANAPVIATGGRDIVNRACLTSFPERV